MLKRQKLWIRMKKHANLSWPAARTNRKAEQINEDVGAQRISAIFSFRAATFYMADSSWYAVAPHLSVCTHYSDCKLHVTIRAPSSVVILVVASGEARSQGKWLARLM